jgi:hypothetical protein
MDISTSRDRPCSYNSTDISSGICDKPEESIHFPSSVHFSPEHLIERLQKLKPSNNFQLGKLRHPRMPSAPPTPLDENCYEIGPPYPYWLMNLIYSVNYMESELGSERAAQRRDEMFDRWDAVYSGMEPELTPLPDLHVLRDMGRSPDGTLFPWYLVKGLITLRQYANNQGDKLYDDEYDIAAAKREETINRWREKNPDSVLAHDLLSVYRTWPQDLMDELDEIDREAVRCGRRKYAALLREAGEKMQTLVSFWEDCGLITGRRSPPLCWWQDPLSPKSIPLFVSSKPTFRFPDRNKSRNRI